MTVEKRHCITLDEIDAFQFQCKNCGVKTVFPVGRQISLAARCFHCGNQWFAPIPQVMGTIGLALENFLQAVGTIAEHAPEIGVIFSVEIKGEKDEEAE